MNITQKMYNLTMKPHRDLYTKIDILNFDMFTIGELSGTVVGGNISINADSDIRRTCSITTCLRKENYNIRFLINKYIKIWIGLKDIDDNIEWFNQGIYIINQPTLKYGKSTRELSFSCTDLMSKLTGTRGGVIGEFETKIAQGSKMRDVIINLLKLGNFNKYVINLRSNETIIPIDLKFNIDSTLYDMLSEIRKIYAFYQIYFDVDGVFHFEPIPKKVDELPIVTNEMFQKLLISYQDSLDFEKIKNSIELYGKTYDPQYYGEINIINGLYSLDIKSLLSLDNYTIVGVQFNQINDNINKIKINNFGTFSLDTMLSIRPNTYYVLEFVDNKATIIGEKQIKINVKDTDEKSIFNIERIGEVKEILSGGEYDMIPNIKLAKDRALYELNQKTQTQNNINIELVPIYYLDVYKLISLGDSAYMLQSIETDLSYEGTQTIRGIKYYAE